jgi:hypothetical protein
LALAVFAIATTTYADSWVLEASGARVEASGNATSDKAGSDGGPIKKGREEVVLKGGAAMVRDLAPLLGDALAKDCARNVNASLIAVGGDGNETARMTFAWAIVTEIAFPAFDGSAGPASEVTLELEPQFPKRVFQKGAVSKPAAGPEWKKSGFKLAIDGLDLKSVKNLGALTITQTPASGTCAAPAVSDLTFALTDAAAIAAWKDAKNGAIDYVAADGSPILKVKLTGLKKKSQSPEGGMTKVTASIEAVAIGRK